MLLRITSNVFRFGNNLKTTPKFVPLICSNATKRGFSHQVSEEVGLGVSVIIPDNVTTDEVWEGQLIKILNPSLVLPVTDVVTHESDDKISTYREMTLGTTRYKEIIYADKSIYTVNYFNLTDYTEIVNVIVFNNGVRSLEYYKRNSETKERIHWNAIKKDAIVAIQKAIDIVKTTTKTV